MHDAANVPAVQEGWAASASHGFISWGAHLILLLGVLWLHTWLRTGFMVLRKGPGSLHKRWCLSGRLPREDSKTKCEHVLRGPRGRRWAWELTLVLCSFRCLTHMQYFLHSAFHILSRFSFFFKIYQEMMSHNETWGISLDLDRYLSEGRRAESCKILKYFLTLRHEHYCDR